MNCPYCNNNETGVLESRAVSMEGAMRRRRQCRKCKKRFTTIEKLAKLDLRVIKKDGRVEAFDRDKVRRGVVKACWKRNVEDEKIEELVDEVEQWFLNSKTVEVRSVEIGRLILEKLKPLDEVAYLRFASVYMDFESARDFINLVNNKGGRKKKRF